MPVRLLTRRDVAALMTPSDYLDAVAAGFAAVGDGGAASPVPLHLSVAEGGFHAKAASYRAARSYVALKFNANFANNPLRYGLPTIQGSILLHDGGDGRLLAIMDSIEVTLRRTAAATALAARHLAHPDAAVLTVCGCGAQARPQIEALLQLLPLRQVLLWDIDPAQAHRLREALTDLPVDVGVAAGLTEATRRSDAIVTCTPSHTAFLGPEAVKPGCFIAAVGADSPHKSEIQPALMASSTVVVDSLAQCASMGDLHHALEAGVMSIADVHAELAELVRGVKPGRRRVNETCLFDSTGTAIQDVASAAVLFERALDRGVGAQLELAAA